MSQRTRRGLWPLALLLFATACIHNPIGGRPVPTTLRYPVVPLPRRVIPMEGTFRLDAGTRIVLADSGDAELRQIADLFAAPLREASGLPLPVLAGTGSADAAAGHAISLGLDADEDWPSPEAYRLEVTAVGVTLTAPTPTGLFRGTQTLRQLLPASLEWSAAAGTAAGSGAEGGPGTGSARAWTVAAGIIEDAPRFPYRGMHLDVARHVFPVPFIKKYIDLLALYKFNTFHWHLTDDQGWRLEIRKYPRLTEVGAWRAETQVGRESDPFVGDSTPYGGYYTQAQVRDIVAYAAARHIAIIPEIEMPGHALAALASYPGLGCGPGPYEVGTHWGVYEDIFCPKEATFAFLENVLLEVMELFPGPYIHVGGDEAPKDAWERSDTAQAVIRREGLAGETELQSWFIRRIERFLGAHGRRLIGWDEILEGGLAPAATVMSWRGMEGGIEAALAGHDVIMTPTSHLYFDYYQGDRATEPLAIGGFTPLRKVYAFDPVPAALSGDAARHVLGAQGNVWTEYITTPEQVEYMAVPRMLALAEVVWSPASARDWDDFSVRLRAQLERLHALGVHYRAPDSAPAAEAAPLER